jgi:pimeloyl-ACP methyl ester carboxylesterase
MNKKSLFRFLKVALLIYGIVGIAIYFLQDYLILRPVKLARNYRFKIDMPFIEVNMPYDEKTNINILQFTTTAVKPKGVVLYFHGNRTNVLRYTRFVPYFTKWGYEVWIIDYPGYGKSTGTFSEDLVYDWSSIMYKLARTRFSADSIIIYGKSLGTGIAAHLASVRNCRYLILETPYYSLPSVVGFYAPIYPVNRLIHHQFPTYKYLPQVTDPIVIMHGTSDWVVPYSNSLKLKPLLKKTDELITIPGGTHNDLYRFPQVPRVLDSLLR